MESGNGSTRGTEWKSPNERKPTGMALVVATTVSDGVLPVVLITRIVGASTNTLLGQWGQGGRKVGLEHSASTLE